MTSREAAMEKHEGPGPHDEHLARVYNIWTASAYQVLMMASWTCNIALYDRMMTLGGPMMLIYSTVLSWLLSESFALFGPIQAASKPLLREISRYGFTQMLDSNTNEAGCNYFTVTVNGRSVNMDKEEVERNTERAFQQFCDVDGKLCRELIPFPHDPHHNPKAVKYERMSVAQRIEEIRPKLNDLELALLLAYIGAISGNDMETTGLFDVLRWWALCNYTSIGMTDLTETYKVAAGQSHFAAAFFDEALSSGNLFYSFDTQIASIKDYGCMVVLSTRASGERFAGKRLVCTIPLNTLHEVEFDPPLHPNKQAASQKGHIGFGAKFHIEASGKTLRSWCGMGAPESRVLTIRGDGLTPPGNTHLVCFAKCSDLQPKSDALDFVEAVQKTHEMDIKQLVWHDWVADPLSRGTWCMFSPNCSFKYLEALRESQGGIHFASGDWALGWRGFIDGAIEEGTRAAKATSNDLGRPVKAAVSL